MCTIDVLETKQYNGEVNVTLKILGFPYFMEKPHGGCVLFPIIFKLLEQKEKFPKII